MNYFFRFDLGFFICSWRRLVLFLVCPLLVLLLFFNVCSGKLSAARKELDEKQSFFVLKPIVVQEIYKAKQLIELHSCPTAAVDAIGSLNTYFSQITQRNQLVLESLDITEAKSKEQSRGRNFEIKFQTQGDIKTVSRFLDDAYASDYFFATDDINVRAIQTQPELIYQLDCRLSYFCF